MSPPVGFKTFDATPMGPFLLARWGESLVPFAEIQQQVAAGPSIAALGDHLGLGELAQAIPAARGVWTRGLR